MAEANKPEAPGQTDGLKLVEGIQPVELTASPLGINALVDKVRGQRPRPAEQAPQPPVAPKPPGMIAELRQIIHSTAILQELGAHLTQSS